ncbi:MAG: DUF2779 domain-containing protein [Clostridiales bacterium]|nr:DUF2779 domain-containing protein [Clostridiales bacterium]
MAWFRKYRPEELLLGSDIQSRMAAGNEVGDLAMGLFGDYVEVTAYDGDKLDLRKMMELTRDEMRKGTTVICEASFEYSGLYCAVDILKKEEDGWAVYEVKSSSKSEDDDDVKPVYIADISYQKYVLENCGIRVNGTYLVCLNKDYVFDGTLDIHKLFTIRNVAEEVAVEEKNIAENLAIAEKMLASSEEPDMELSVHCHKPYHCGFWKHCTAHLPSPSVFDLYNIRFSTAIKYYYRGLTGYEDLLSSPVKLNEKQLRQIEHHLFDREAYIDKAGIRNFLNTLSYPLYFLDFETEQPPVPKYAGTRPYTQIPFQYSLHYTETEGGELKHTEFLGESGKDPRRALAEQLCADIPLNVCTVAYNKNFECGRIGELADAFPDLAEHLLNIKENMRDIAVPFQSGCYYNKAMGGSFSIKSVLPALFPDDPALDYHSLEGVHNGGEAMSIYPQIQYMEPDEREKARHDLLKYCELDTYAMVKVWQELVRAAGS